jgi:hypothetical protein
MITNSNSIQKDNQYTSFIEIFSGLSIEDKVEPFSKKRLRL